MFIITWYDDINKVDKQKLSQVVSEEYTYAHVMHRLGFSQSRSKTMYDALRRVMQENNIDYSHFGYRRLKNLDEQLIKGSTYNAQTLKQRLVTEGMLKEECNICGLGAIWNELPLVLQLDHINGDNTDNRLENLRILCPNCHTQTDTFAGRNIKNS